MIVSQWIIIRIYDVEIIMSLEAIIIELQSVFSGTTDIERRALESLQKASFEKFKSAKSTPLPAEIVNVMEEEQAHPICKSILNTELDWCPPTTSNDKLYIEHSKRKAHVEILGPNGLITSNSVRIGLYGMLSQSEYGIRTHPAEEIYIALAGVSYWKRGSDKYQELLPGESSYHPSLMPHASKTEKKAFMSVYVWNGDISMDNYRYKGLPKN